MIVPLQSSLSAVIDILTSESHDLYQLAALSGRPVFSFYNNSDLRNIDISGQDLRGLNFKNADLRSANLENVDFDDGAFNESILDSKHDWLTDKYEFSVDDLESYPIDQILVFCRMRSGIVDRFVSNARMTYSDFAGEAGISTAALRKCRNEAVVAFDTAKGVLKSAINIASHHSFDDDTTKNWLRLPNVEFLSGGINRPFVNVSRKRLRKLFAIRAFRIQDASRRYNQDVSTFRDTPEFLAYEEHRYDEIFQGPDSWEW